MASTSFGKKASELVREIAESEVGSIPPYNQDLVRTICEQCHDHFNEAAVAVMASGSRESEGEEADELFRDRIKTTLLVHNQAILRNKRGLLIYLNERMNRVKDLRWRIGAGLPEELSANLSHSERHFLTRYSSALNDYMREVDLNLTLDLVPPQHHKIQVKCLEDYGELFTRDGTVDLRRNTVHLLWREEAQPLIHEGVLEQLDYE